MALVLFLSHTCHVDLELEYGPCCEGSLHVRLSSFGFEALLRSHVAWQPQSWCSGLNGVANVLANS